MKKLRFASRAIGNAIATVVSIAGLAAGASQVVAGSLDAKTCRVLLNEKQALDAAGVGAHLERGPQWAQANLDAAGIQRIKQYITLEEQILFRCPTGFQNAVLVAIKGTAPSSGPPPLPLKVARASVPVAVPLPTAARREAAPAPVRAEPGEADVPLPAKNLQKATPTPGIRKPPAEVKRKPAAAAPPANETVAAEPALPRPTQWRLDAFNPN